MAKSITVSKDDASIVRKAISGRIQKRNVENQNISVEKKCYTLSELSGLQGKFKRIESPLSIDDEKIVGKVSW